MNVDQTILIFFRLLNFAVVIAIMIYLWKRFGRSYVVVSYDKEQEYLDSLARTHTVLRQEERAIQRGIAADEKERSLLKDRLLIWREALQKEQAALTAEKETRLQILTERLQKQVQRVNAYRLYRDMQKKAIDEVRTHLEKEYESTQMQASVIENVLTKMGEK